MKDQTVNMINMRAGGFQFPFVFPMKTIVSVKDADQVESDPELKARLASGLPGISSASYITPLTLYPVDEVSNQLKLPVDPIISIDGKNIITRRYVAKSKMRGSIKERWSQDDYAISIAGVIVADSADELKVMVQALRKMLENGRNGLEIKCDLLNNYMDIQRIAVEDFSFPHTAGEENQAFTIKAYSDDVYYLLENAL